MPSGTSVGGAPQTKHRLFLRCPILRRSRPVESARQDSLAVHGGWFMRNLLAGIGAVLLGTSFISYAQSPELIPLTDNETPALWFVELASPPVIEGSSGASLELEEAAFHAAAADAGVRYSETRHFRDLF